MEELSINSINSSGDSMQKRNRKKYRKDKERQEGRHEYLCMPTVHSSPPVEPRGYMHLILLLLLLLLDYGITK
jgi:hypothetical protein